MLSDFNIAVQIDFVHFIFKAKCSQKCFKNEKNMLQKNQLARARQLLGATLAWVFMVRLDSTVRVLWVAGQGYHYAALQLLPARAIRMPTGSIALGSPSWAPIHTPCAPCPQSCVSAHSLCPCLSCAARVLCPNLCPYLTAQFPVAPSLCTCLGLWTVADPGCGCRTRSALA